MIYDQPYIQLSAKTVYIDTSALTKRKALVTRRKTLVKTFFASPLISSHVNNLTFTIFSIYTVTYNDTINRIYDYM